jgi:hypothetical protein
MRHAATNHLSAIRDEVEQTEIGRWRKNEAIRERRAVKLNKLTYKLGPEELIEEDHKAKATAKQRALSIPGMRAAAPGDGPHTRAVD